MSDFVSHEPPASDIPAEERQWAMFAHLSALVAIWLAGLGFVGRLIVWLVQKDKMKFVDDQGKEALNFQLNLLALTIILFPVGAILGFVTFGIGLLLLIPVVIGLGAAGIVFPILAAIKAYAGETYRYPYIIRVIA